MNFFKKILLTLALLFTISYAKSFTLFELSFFSSDCGHPIILIPDSLYNDLENVRVVVSISAATDFETSTSIYYDTVTLDNTDYFEYLGDVNFTSDSSGVRHGFRFIFSDYTPENGTMTMIDLETIYDSETVLWGSSAYKSCIPCPSCINRRAMLIAYNYLPWRLFNSDYPFSGYDTTYAALSIQHKMAITTVLNWIFDRSATIIDYLDMLDPAKAGQTDVHGAFCNGSSDGYNSCHNQNILLGIAQYANEQFIAIGPNDETSFYGLQDDANNYAFTQCDLSTNYFFHLQSTSIDTGFIFNAVPLGQAGLPTIITKVVFDNGTAYSAIAYSYNFSSIEGIEYAGGGVFNYLNGFKAAIQDSSALPFPRLTITSDGSTAFCMGGNVILTAQYGSGDFYWAPVSDNNDSITVNDSGEYTLQIVDEEGCYADADTTITVTIYNSPLAHAGRDTTICSGLNVTLGADTAVSDGIPPYTYSWFPSSDLDTVTNAHPLASPTVSTTYTLTVTDAIGCTGSDNMVVIVHEVPGADAGQDTSICKGQSVLIGNAASGGTSPYTYDWSFGIGLDDSTIAQPIANPTVTSGYRLSVVDDNGCLGSDSVTIIVYNAKADAGDDRTECQGNSIVIGGSKTASGGYAPYSYAWKNFAGDTLFTEPNPGIIADSSSSFIVEITDALGCYSRDTMSVTVNLTPTLNLANSIYLSMGDTIILGGSPTVTGGTSPYTYSWSSSKWLDDSTKSNPVSKPKCTSFYHLFVSDSAGCNTQGNVEVYFSPINLRTVENYSLLSSDSVKITDSSSVDNIAGAANFVSDNILSDKEIQIGSTEVHTALADFDSITEFIENLSADTISSTLPDTINSSGIYRILGNVTLNHNLTFAGNDSSFYVLDIQGSFNIGNNITIGSKGVDTRNILIRSAGDVTMGSNISFTGSLLGDGKIKGHQLTLNGRLGSRGGTVEYEIIVAIIAIIGTVNTFPIMSTFHTIPNDYFGINTESGTIDFSPGDKDNIGGSFTDPNFERLLPGMNFSLLRIRGGRAKEQDWNSGWWKAPNYLRYGTVYNDFNTTHLVPASPINYPFYIRPTLSLAAYPYLQKNAWRPDFTEYKLPTDNSHYIIENRPEHHRFVAEGTGAQLMLTLDMHNSNRDYEMKWIDFTRATNYGAKYVELDNELYLSGNNISNAIYPNAQKFVVAANNFLDYIHANYSSGPQVKVGVPLNSPGLQDEGGTENDDQSPYDCRQQTWNAALGLPALCSGCSGTSCTGCNTKLHLNTGDALIFHLYANSGLTKIKYNPGSGDVFYYDGTASHIYPRKVDIPTMMVVPFETIHNFKINQTPLLPTGIDAWITEFNMSEHSQDVAINGTWAHGLFLSSYILGMLEEARITHITPHTYIGDATHGLFFSTTKFVNDPAHWKEPGISSSLITANPWEKTASGHCVSLIGKAFNNTSAVVQMDFKKIIPIPSGSIPLIKSDKPYKTLYGWIFLHTQSKNNELIILNLGDKATSVYTGNLTITAGTYNGSSSAPYAGKVFPPGYCISYEQYSSVDPTVYVKGNSSTVAYDASTGIQYLPGSPNIAPLIYNESKGSVINLPAYSITRVFVDGWISVTASRSKVCVNDAVSVKAEGQSDVSWDFGTTNPGNKAHILYDSPKQTSVTLKFDAAGTYTIYARSPVYDCTGNVVPGQFLWDSKSIEVIAAPTVTVTTTYPDANGYCEGSGAVQLQASVSGGSSPSFWWAPTEGLYDGNTISTANSTIQGSTIYARPLDPNPKYILQGYENTARYYVRGIATTDGITCLTEPATGTTKYTDVKINAGADSQSPYNSYRIRYHNNLTGVNILDNIDLCASEAGTSFTLQAVDRSNGIKIIPSATFYMDNDPTPLSSVTFSTGLLKSAKFYARFTDGNGCKHLISFDYMVTPEPILDASKLETCEGEYLHLFSSGADGKYSGDLVNGNYTWTPLDGGDFYRWRQNSQDWDTPNNYGNQNYYMNPTAGTFHISLTATSGGPTDECPDEIWANTITGTGITPNVSIPYTSGDIITGVTVSGISLGAGLTGVTSNDCYNASGWTTSGIGSAISGNDYFEFVITPSSAINFNNFTYTGQITSGGTNTRFAFRSSVDGFTNNIGMAKAEGTTILLTDAAFQGISSVITFRFYVYNATSSTTYSIKDFAFNGTSNSITFPVTVYGAPSISCSDNCTILDGPRHLVVSGADYCQWNIIGGMLLDGSGKLTVTGNDVYAMAPGHYVLTAVSYSNTAAGCCSQIDLDLDGCRLEEPEEEATQKKSSRNLQLYPNPNEGKFLVNINNPVTQDEVAELSIVNLLGERVYFNQYSLQKGESFHKNIIVSEPGQYIVSVKLGSEYYHSTFVSLKD